MSTAGTCWGLHAEVEVCNTVRSYSKICAPVRGIDWATIVAFDACMFDGWRQLTTSYMVRKSSLSITVPVFWSIPVLNFAARLWKHTVQRRIKAAWRGLKISRPVLRALSQTGPPGQVLWKGTKSSLSARPDSGSDWLFVLFQRPFRVRASWGVRGGTSRVMRWRWIQGHGIEIGPIACHTKAEMLI